MPQPLLLGVAGVCLIILSFYSGFMWARQIYRPQPIQGILETLHKELPNELAAYRKGIDEGYAQGMHDSREPPI